MMMLKEKNIWIDKQINIVEQEKKRKLVMYMIDS